MYTYIYIFISYSYWQLGDFHEQILPPLHQKPCVGYLLWKKTWLFWFKKKQPKNPWDFPSGISDFVAKLQTWATQVEGAHVVMVNFGVHSGNHDIFILTILMCRYITLHVYIVIYIYIIFSLYLYINIFIHWYFIGRCLKNRELSWVNPGTSYEIIPIETYREPRNPM